MPKPTAIDLFCGAGGLSLGLRAAGFDVRLAVDNDARSVQTYRNNISDHVLQASITEVSADGILSSAGLVPGQCDLLAGGPPCQGFSVQRRGPDHDERNHLVLEFLRLVREIRPKFFLMENVSGLTSTRGRSVLDDALRTAASVGYRTHLRKLDAVRYGVPQFRIRTLLVGEMSEQGGSWFEFPSQFLGEGEFLTVRDAIGDLPSPPSDGTPHPHIANHYREARMSAKNLERLKHVPEGGGREHLPEHLQLPCHRNNLSHRHLDVYGRLAWNAPAGTITARFDSFTRGRFGHPIEHRSITLREGARLQTFPDEFEFFGNREECARQIGNAVPPRLAEALGHAIRDALEARNSGAIGTRSPRPVQLTLLSPFEGVGA